ncbi:MFS transporter [Kitasatospora sp. McL0602]|uniref:MFS transporter n=1 Tax=Kitasatospora sp. McL0602 TaxID=3439530 RepID=UPI003F892292
MELERFTRAGLLALALGTFAVGTDSFLLAGMLPQMAAALHVSIPVGGQVIIAYALAHALLSPAVVAALRWPSKPVMLAGLSLLVLGNVLTGLAPDFGLVVACRILAALGGAVFLPICTVTAVSTVPPHRRGFALSTVRGGSTAAAALGIPTGVAFATLADWRLAMYFVAALGALAAVCVALLTPGLPATAPIRPSRGLAPLADSRIGLTLLMTALVFCGLFTPYSYAAQLFHDGTGTDGGRLALLLGAWGAAALTGALTSARLTDRLGARRVIRGCGLIGLINLALTPWSADRPLTALLAAVVWGYCGWVLIVPIQHRLIGFNPAAAPFSILLTSTACYTGLALSGAVGALLMTWTDARYLGPVAAAIMLIGLAVGELRPRLAY